MFPSGPEIIVSGFTSGTVNVSTLPELIVYLPIAVPEVSENQIFPSGPAHIYDRFAFEKLEAREVMFPLIVALFILGVRVAKYILPSGPLQIADGLLGLEYSIKLEGVFQVAVAGVEEDVI
jgi:hypothetical protein